MRKLSQLEKQLGRSSDEYTRNDINNFRNDQPDINPIAMKIIIQLAIDEFIDNLLKKYVVTRKKPGSRKEAQSTITGNVDDDENLEEGLETNEDENDTDIEEKIEQTNETETVDTDEQPKPKKKKRPKSKVKAKTKKNKISSADGKSVFSGDGSSNDFDDDADL